MIYILEDNVVSNIIKKNDPIDIIEVMNTYRTNGDIQAWFFYENTDDLTMILHFTDIAQQNMFILKYL